MSVELYVATDGNDAWSGKLPAPNPEGTDGPLATLAGARDAVRGRKAAGDLSAPVTVWVRGGRYYLDRTLVLGAADSGTPECPISYRAYPGERPVISGGRRLTGWEPYQGDILCCAVPEARGGAWRFRELFLDGVRQTRARFPNLEAVNPAQGGYLAVEGPAEEGSLTELRYPEGAFPRVWAQPTQGELFIWDPMNWGYTTTAPIRAVDYGARTIRLRVPVKDFNVAPWFYPTPIAPGQRFYVENLLEELDQPGEWCLDTEAGRAYFWPPAGDVNLERTPVVAPYLERLVDLRASYVTLSGLTFTETRRAGEGAHPTGINAMQGAGSQFSPLEWGYCGEALHLQKAEHCIIEDCELRNLGGNGLYLQQRNRHNQVRRNRITNCGSNGVVLAGTRGGHRIENLGYISLAEYPAANEVTDNEIDHIGVWDRSAAGVFLGCGESNSVSHNLLHHVPHHAVNLGNDGYGRNYVEYNRIHHACLETSDTGAVNVWMEGPPDAPRAGHLIRFNFISDVGSDRYSGHATPHTGIYLDNEASNCLVYGNIVARVSFGVVFKGRNNVIENNIFADIRQPEAILSAGGVAPYCLLDADSPWFGAQFNSGHRVVRNLLYRAPYVAYLCSEAGAEAIGSWDYNLYWNDGQPLQFVVRAPGEPPVAADNVDLETWRRTTGFDAHSLVAEVGFVDAEHDDYRLRPDSPALGLGFVPIDMGQIGPRPEGERE